MEVTFDPVLISDAIEESGMKAVRSALGGWDVQNAIGQCITKEIAEGVIAEAIRGAVEKIDTGALVSRLATEIEKSCVRAAITLLQEGLCSTVLTLRTKGNYMPDKERLDLSARIKAELFG